MDETYLRVKGSWKYLYRAVDKAGATVDFLLTDETAGMGKLAAKADGLRGSGETAPVAGFEVKSNGIIAIADPTKSTAQVALVSPGV